MNWSTKKSFILLTFVFSLFLLPQAQAQFSVGGGIGYGTAVKDVGINLRAMYGFTEDWRIGYDLIFYIDGVENASTFENNVNGHYVFVNTNGLRAYGLAGLNFFTSTVSFGGIGASNTEIGLNLGAGAQYNFPETIGVLLEPRFAISQIDQLAITGGVIFTFGG